MKKYIFTFLLLILANNVWAKKYVVDQAGKTYIKEVSKDQAEAINADSSGAKAKDMKLEKLMIKVGDEVEFRNQDDVTHNVYSDDFDFKAQEKGHSDTYTFNKKGSYKIKCGIHSKMKMEIIVE